MQAGALRPIRTAEIALSRGRHSACASSSSAGQAPSTLDLCCGSAVYMWKSKCSLPGCLDFKEAHYMNVSDQHFGSGFHGRAELKALHSTLFKCKGWGYGHSKPCVGMLLGVNGQELVSLLYHHGSKSDTLGAQGKVKRQPLPPQFPCFRAPYRGGRQSEGVACRLD